VNKNLWLTVALCGLSLIGCAKRVETEQTTTLPQPADFYPLALGNRWTYLATFLGEQRTQQVEILKVVEGYYQDSQGGQLTVDAFGVRDQKRYLLREPLEVGRTWTNVVSVSSVEHYKVIEVGQSCESPAGKFYGCVRVEGRNRVDEHSTLVNEFTFAPAVGLVRVKVVAEVDGKRIPQTELVLRDYQVKPSAKAVQ
jgi:hypothetical protein